MMEIIFSPLMLMGLVFIAMPFLAFIPAAVFGWLYLKTKQRTNLIAAVLWVLYTLYESAIKMQFLCDGECNLRVDLLLLYPVLIIVSVVALVRSVVWIKKNRKL